MRGLVQAAAVVLSPALALAHGPHHPPPPPPPPPPMGFLPSALDVTPSAFVTVKVPWSETESYPLTLRFDVEEAEEVCGSASIKLNGEPLKQDAKGHGVGSFLINNETVISADWDFECIGPKEFPFGQSMRFNVNALDDMALTEESSFWMTFKQTAPVRISDVGNADYVWSLSMPFSSKDKNTSSDDKSATNSPPSIWEYPDRKFQDPEEELQVELMELNALHKQILQLEELVKEREESVSKKLGKKYPPPPPSTLKKIKQCDGVQCVLHTVGHEMRHSAHKFYDRIFGPHHGPHHGPPHGPHHGNGTHPGPHPPHHGPPPPPPHHGHPPFPFPGGHPPPPMCAPCSCDPHHGNPPPPPHHGDKPHKPHHDEPENGPHDGFRAEGHEGHHHPPPPPHNPIILIFGIGAIALALFCAISIAYIHRRVARLSPESRRAIRKAFRQSRSERRKDSALKTAYRAFISRWMDSDDDEKEAMLRGDRRRRASSASSVTMEEEIAQFREAAHMVEGIVAAEEGREHHHSHARSYSHPLSYTAGPPVPPRPSHHTAATAYPGFIYTDEHLPAYDDDERDSSVVADGCRYTPGSSDYTPSSTGSNASDVLGDTKN